MRQRLITADTIQTAHGSPGNAVLVQDGTIRAIGNAADLRSPGLIEERYSGSENVFLHLRRVGPEEVQTFFRAADWVVCPYRATLNSGVAVLAHDFGVPVIGPRAGAIGEMIDGGGGLGYERGRPADLRATLARAAQSDASSYVPAIQMARQARAPAPATFVDGLRSALGW